MNNPLMRWLRRVWPYGPPDSGETTGPASAYPLAERERTLIEEKRVAEEANRVKSAVLAAMSHEIRNPLNAIMAVAEVLKDGRLARDQLELVETISSAGQSLLAIVDDVLDFAKIEAGRMEVDVVAFSVMAVLGQALSLWAASAEQKGLELQLDPVPELPELLLGDPQRLSQILNNYLSNAVKFTTSGQVRLGVERLDEQDGRLRLRFRVRDTGHGIPNELQAVIFHPFTQWHKPGAARGAGTGLGLAICRELATLLAGTVGVYSSAGRGSEFWVELPFAIASPAPRAAEAPQGPRPDSPRALGGCTVLVVDDNAVNLEVASRLLTRQGARVQTASSALQALAQLTQGAVLPGLILLDIEMPGLDGVELARRIRALPGGARPRLVALSGSQLASRSPELAAAGMDGYIAKPFDVREMTDTLLRVLAGPDVDRGTEPAVPKQGIIINSLNESFRENMVILDANSAFPQLRGHDRMLAARRLDGDRALYLRSLRLFETELALAARALARALESDCDLTLLAGSLHRLKGAAAAVAAVETARIAEDLENALPKPVDAAEASPQEHAILPQELRDALLLAMRHCERQRGLLHEDLLASAAPAERVGPLPEDGSTSAGSDPGVVEVFEGNKEIRQSLNTIQKESVQSISPKFRKSLLKLIGLLERHDLQAMDTFRELQPQLAPVLSRRQDRDVRMALDVLAFERAAVILGTLTEMPHAPAELPESPAPAERAASVEDCGAAVEGIYGNLLDSPSHKLSSD